MIIGRRDFHKFIGSALAGIGILKSTEMPKIKKVKIDKDARPEGIYCTSQVDMSINSFNRGL